MEVLYHIRYIRQRLKEVPLQSRWFSPMKLGRWKWVSDFQKPHHDMTLRQVAIGKPPFAVLLSWPLSPSYSRARAGHAKRCGSSDFPRGTGSKLKLHGQYGPHNGSWTTGSININQRMSMRGLWWGQNIKYINHVLFYQHPPIPIDILIATASSHSVIHISSLRRHRAGSCRALGAEFGQCHGSRSCSKKRHWEWCASASRAHCHRICGSQSSPRRKATTHSFLRL